MAQPCYSREGVHFETWGRGCTTLDRRRSVSLELTLGVILSGVEGPLPRRRT